MKNVLIGVGILVFGGVAYWLWKNQAKTTAKTTDPNSTASKITEQAKKFDPKADVSTVRIGTLPDGTPVFAPKDSSGLPKDSPIVGYTAAGVPVLKMPNGVLQTLTQNIDQNVSYYFQDLNLGFDFGLYG